MPDFTPGIPVEERSDPEEEMKGLLPFQAGIAQSCIALKKLYKRMKAKYNCKYLLTSRLNQGSEY